MTIATFGVTYTTVRQDWFPQFGGEFSATSTPTSTRVTTFIGQEAADLAGHLRLKGLTATSLEAVTTTEAYQWCQKTLGIAAAARAAKVMTGATPELVKSLEDDRDARYKLLDTHGAAAMGAGADVPADTDEPEGPTSHIDDLDLDTGEGDGVTSDVAPVIRRNDML